MTVPAIRGRLMLGLALLALGGCRARDNDPGPGGVTVGEARALDDAAKMLESRPQVVPLAPGSGAAPAPAVAPSQPAPAKRP